MNADLAALLADLVMGEDGLANLLIADILEEAGHDQAARLVRDGFVTFGRATSVIEDGTIRVVVDMPALVRCARRRMRPDQTSANYMFSSIRVTKKRVAS